MTDQEIEQAGETLKRLLHKHKDCQFGRIETTIHKGHVKDMTLHREETGIRNGEIVTLQFGE